MKITRSSVSILTIFSIVTVFGIYLLVRKQNRRAFYVCTRNPPVKIRGRAPAFTPNYKLAWPNNQVLRVFFEEGRTPITNEVMRIAQEWSNHCSIKFVLARSIILSDIRVTFLSGGLSSAVGKECAQPEYNSRSTMCLEGIEDVTDKTEFRRIVLHEFGHALGLEHELKNPNAKIAWNKPKVYKYYKDKYDWNETKVDNTIFKLLEPGEKQYSDFDRTSIMVYAVGPPLAADTIPWAKDLSSSDKTGIATWYPKNLIK